MPFPIVGRAYRALLPSLAVTAITAAPPNFPGPTPDFRPLQFLVGHCWVGAFPDGRATDEHCFEWVFDRKFIRDRHLVRGRAAPYEGETLYGWDARAARITWWYWNSDGDVLTGTVDVTPHGLVFPTRLETPQGPVELRATWIRTGPDTYRVDQAKRDGDRWAPLWTMEFRRTR